MKRSKLYNYLGKIGVICGGLSSERAISLKSGRAIYDALLKHGFSVEEIDLESEDEQTVITTLRSASIDVVFIAMHGRFGEDGQLQAILEKIDMVYVGSDSLASAFAMDKITSRRIFQEHNIPVPPYRVFDIDSKIDLLGEKLKFPFVVKPCAQGSSIGISLVRTPEEIQQALSVAFCHDRTVIIEDYIKGKEITVGILEHAALEPIEIVSKNQFFDFQAKYNAGMTDYLLPAPIASDLREKIKELSLRAHRALGCRHFSRVDLVLDEQDNPFVLEVNTIPGFTATSLLPKAARYQGIAFPKLCLKLLDMALKECATPLKI